MRPASMHKQCVQGASDAAGPGLYRDQKKGFTAETAEDAEKVRFAL